MLDKDLCSLEHSSVLREIKQLGSVDAKAFVFMTVSKEVEELLDFPSAITLKSKYTNI